MERTAAASQSQRLAAGVVVAMVVGAASAASINLSAHDGDELIQRVVTQTTRTGISIRATRELRAGTRTGKHIGWMAVDTTVSPNGGFSWTVLREGGSERTRNRLFRQLLDAEADAWRTSGRDAAALTLDNYEFARLTSVAAGEIKIQLKPRREDPRLIAGTLTVGPDGYPLALEGRLAKSPSFWVRSVSVVKRFGRFGDVALPTFVESIADVKLFGPATFSMRYRYSEVDGRSITGHAFSHHSAEPSPQLLTLFEQGQR